MNQKSWFPTISGLIKFHMGNILNKLKLAYTEALCSWRWSALIAGELLGLIKKFDHLE